MPISVYKLIKILFIDWKFLSKFEIYTRSYYETISKFYNTYGRNGYVFEESLGTPLTYRIYNNYITYKIYEKLSPKFFSIFCYLFYISSYIFIGFSLDNLSFTFLTLPLLIVSPVMLHYIFCNLTKPEVIFWPVAMIIYYYAITDFWIYVIILSSIILFANFISVHIFLLVLV